MENFENHPDFVSYFVLYQGDTSPARPGKAARIGAALATLYHLSPTLVSGVLSQFDMSFAYKAIQYRRAESKPVRYVHHCIYFNCVLELVLGRYPRICTVHFNLAQL
jgi:hypothetical protein